MRPAVAALVGDHVIGQWPATCETEALRAKKHTGGHAWGTKLIPQDVVSVLADRIRYEIGNGGHAWARDFLILHTIRGTKDTTEHRVDAASAASVLREFTQGANLRPDATIHGAWYIDVAIEISSEKNHCMQWMTLGHPEILRQALCIPSNNALRSTKIGARGYSRDLASHLTAISGFRLVPGQRAQEQVPALYVQAYTTDKAIVYNPEGGHHAKFLTAKEALGSTQPPPMVTDLHTIYDQATRNNSSNARLEIRVPFAHAQDVLLEFDPSRLRQCLCAFKRRVWW